MSGLTGVVSDWSFVRTTPPLAYVKKRVGTFALRAHRAPAHLRLKPVRPAPRWTVYFVYAPQGQLSDAHHFTLRRLRELGRPLLVVCAAPAASAVPGSLVDYADALYWKDLPGFDFSAYTLALGEISRLSEGADVFVMNDSVFGPFGDLPALERAARWDLSAFTASPAIENHIQSYAFLLRQVTRPLMSALRSVFIPWLAFNRFPDVVSCQETRLARVASRHMSVGALWYPGPGAPDDLPRLLPAEMVAAGFPFLKRSLLGKFAGLHDRAQLEAILRAQQHPVS